MMLSLLLLAAVAQNSVDCAKAQTTADISECSQKQYAAADAEMTLEWKAAYSRMKRFDGPAKKSSEIGYAAALLDSQRKWIAFRDSECRIEGYRMRGGSGQGYSTAICLTNLTQKRARQLRDMDF